MRGRRVQNQASKGSSRGGARCAARSHRASRRPCRDRSAHATFDGAYGLTLGFGSASRDTGQHTSGPAGWSGCRPGTRRGPRLDISANGTLYVLTLHPSDIPSSFNIANRRGSSASPPTASDLGPARDLPRSLYPRPSSTRHIGSRYFIHPRMDAVGETTLINQGATG